MGKKGRRTRWRTLTITDEHSDSEESNTTTSGHREPKGYPQKSYYSRFTYSSQSTPTRRYQCDGTKSTRSSSTASENKITFNEDEYTRITTPRQDVLFKKGYLNKPKTYQTQTSTGNSTTSTGNSTGNGTPDHQSTDLEYESQFVFPNGFVDQNGIYYVNSFEPYPVMVYNPPTYYSEYENVKTKRCSTGSLTESTSPNNEETSQDPSQNETATTISELNQVYSVVYPGFYYNGACQPQVEASDPEPRRVKKRRRRKRSKSPAQEGTTTESSSEEEEEKEEEEDEKPEPEDETDSPKTKYDLKPDAEEFVPRAYRLPETIPVEANVQFIKIPSNFVPVPILNPMGEFNAFIPHGIPINFVPPNYVNFVPYKTPSVQMEEKEEKNEEETVKETVEVPKTNQIDIAKIVSKLEEAAKEQDENVKGENQNKTTKKRFRYQKVELRKPPPSPEPRRKPTSPKKEESIPKPVRNYSDTLKKSIVPQQCERHERHMEKAKINRAPSKETTPKKTPPKVSNEWISVSSRKKRKNKNVEETEDFEEIEVVEKKEIEVVEKKEIEIVKKEEIEIVKKEEIEVVEKEETVSRVEETIPIVAPPPPPPPQPVEPEKKPKKKTKKNQKTTLPVTKRVIITDIDLSIEEPKVEEPTVEEKKLPPEEPVEKKESPEKKSKKKKKKVSKLAILSDSSSSTTLNLNDDSYDFLLDESLEKTNVEVSQELDKMIQRGMYNSLEEKIKSMNIESNDNFFKSIIGNISSRESSVEKNHPFVKNPDLGKLLTLKPTIRKSNDFLGETATPNPLGGGGTDSKPPQDENLYPITKAVKEWMTKAREATPDVEILKSPSTIFREFGDETDYTRKSSASSIEEGEEVLETYGDELKIEEMKNYPKHGNLPYRAICCSIM